MKSPAAAATNVHATAIIDPGAKIPSSCRVGPYCVIGAEVELGEDNELISHIAIGGPTKIGRNNKIFPFVSVGMEPQDLKFNGEKTRLEIGDDNHIGECVTSHPGTPDAGGI